MFSGYLWNYWYFSVQSSVIFNIAIDVSRFYTRIFNTTQYLSFQYLWRNKLQKSGIRTTWHWKILSRLPYPIATLYSENWETSGCIRVCVTKIKHGNCFYGLSHWFSRACRRGAEQSYSDWNNHILRKHGFINQPSTPRSISPAENVITEML